MSMNFTAVGIAGVIAASFLVLYFVKPDGRTQVHRTEVSIASSIESIQSVGELTVLRAVLKEIAWGKVGIDDDWHKPKKAAFIFQFEIDFSYNLSDPTCEITQRDGRVVVRLPKVRIRSNIKDVNEYHREPGVDYGYVWNTQKDLSSEDFNTMKDQALKNAKRESEAMVADMRSQCQASARTVLSNILRGVGVEAYEISFQ
jgi:hypothetical protein